MKNTAVCDWRVSVVYFGIRQCGVRALWPFVDHVSFEKLGSHQQCMFLVLDVVLFAALLDVWSDGIHSLINSFTTFLDTTAQKAQQSANTAKK